MEKDYHGWGSELTNEITMMEAGVPRFVAKDKGSFRDRDATLEARPRGRAVHMAIDATDTDARGAEPVLMNDKVFGVTTSAADDQRIGQSLAFAYVPSEVAAHGTQLEVQLLGKPHRATILAEPPLRSVQNQTARLSARGTT
ncbi:MAG: glycine cleavage T C-terminal barrel domain-containing protein [Hyphomicrobiaceae bacterium]